MSGLHHWKLNCDNLKLNILYISYISFKDISITFSLDSNNSDKII